MVDTGILSEKLMSIEKLGDGKDVKLNFKQLCAIYGKLDKNFVEGDLFTLFRELASVDLKEFLRYVTAPKTNGHVAHTGETDGCTAPVGEGITAKPKSKLDVVPLQITSNDPASQNAGDNAKRALEEAGQTDVDRVSKSLKKDPHLLILYTGGTIGMMATADGYAPKKGYLPKRMAELPMFQDPVKPIGTMPKSIYGRHTTYEIIEYEPLIDSSSMSQEEWIRIAKDIHAAYEKYDGFIVLHGTDTMGHTASALSFMLENLAKPVVVTGSQIPLSELRNDGVENLLGSMLIAGHFQIPEVMLFFRSRVMRGNRTWKESSHSLDGFSSPNLPPLATVSITIDVDWDNVLPMPGDPLILHTKLVKDISIITLFPGISPQLVRAQLAPPVAGAILQTFGAGNAPENQELLDVFEDASNRGVLLVNVTQCRHGGVAAGAYAAGAGLMKAKVVPMGDITLEAAMAKMSVVLGYGLSIESARAAMSRNLCGEIPDEKPDEKLLSLSSTAFIRAVSKSFGTFGVESRKSIQKVLLPVMACCAAGAGSVTELAGIFRVGESADCCDYDQRAPLHIAAAEGYVDCVKFLIEKKYANVNVADRWGSLPLDDAALKQHTEVCDILLQNGAKASPRLTEQLFSIVDTGDVVKATCLIKCKADVNYVDYDGRSMLMLAARKSADLVRLLLDAGADPLKKDTWGHTAKDEAKDAQIKKMLGVQ
jgi:lysophospholipase